MGLLGVDLGVSIRGFRVTVPLLSNLQQISTTDHKVVAGPERLTYQRPSLLRKKTKKEVHSLLDEVIVLFLSPPAGKFLPSAYPPAPCAILYFSSIKNNWQIAPE